MSEILIFKCTNCNASLTKPEIDKHNCIICPTHVTVNGEDDKMNKNSETENNIAVLVKSNNNQKANNHKCWNEFFSEIVGKYETNDEKLKIVLNSLKARTNVPRKENKFHNYINAFLPSKNVPDCAKIIWDIISSHEGFQIFKDKLPTANNETSENANKLTKKRKIPNSEGPEMKKSTPDDQTDDNAKAEPDKIPNTDNKRTWDDIVVERLTNFETTDENLKIVIDRIKIRKHLPQKEIKFANLLSTIPQSRTVENCTKILWDIISKSDPNATDELLNRPTSETDNETHTMSNEQPPKREQFSKPTLNQNQWYESAIELLNRHHTDDIDLQTVINTIKTRKNLPRKLNKFTNFINAIPLSKKVPNCVQIIWDIVSLPLPTNEVHGENTTEAIIIEESAETAEMQDMADLSVIPAPEPVPLVADYIDSQETPVVDEFENY